MKRFVLFCITLCLLLPAGCKTRRVTESWSGYQQWREMEGIASRFSALTSVDTLLSQWQRHLSGQITLWSPPDSAGRQYIRAGIVLDSGETGDSRLYRHTVGSDSTYMVSGGREQTTAGAGFMEEKTHDSRPVARVMLLVIFTGLGLIALFLYYKKKNNILLT